MQALTEDNKYDVVYLIVSPKNPIKDIDPNSAQRRFEAAKDAAARHPEVKVLVDDIELHMEAPQYTYKTLDALRLREPENNFTLVMGADNLAILPKWRESEYILKEYGIVVYPREGCDLDTLVRDLQEKDEEYKIDIINAPMVNVSSTQIREGLERGEDMSHLMM